MSLSFTQTESRYKGGIKNISLYIDGREYKRFPREYHGEEVVFDFSTSPILLSTGARVIGLAGDISAEFNGVFSFKLAKVSAQDKQMGLMLSENDVIGDKSLQSGLQFSSVFCESEGAVVYKGDEAKGLHTRVFINKEDLPTYEAKELGLAKIKYDTYPYDVSIIITGNEVNDYFKVLLDAMSKVFPELAAKTEHYSHGMLRLPTGKMSSRTGDVITAESLIADTKVRVMQKIAESDFSIEEKDTVAEAVAIGAIKYSILRQASGKDIIFDFEQSLSFEGDSGPYLQYAYARTRSLLAKAAGQSKGSPWIYPRTPLGMPEKVHLLHKYLLRFPEVVLRAEEEREPHYIATYLIELAREFSSFYGNTIVLDGGPDESYKLALVSATSNILKKGLWLLGMPILEKM
jgi:arginyl-tRNA synthetase